MKKCDYCQHVEMCGWRKELEERGCDFFDDGNKWIPVNERLPERNKRVFVCYETIEELKVDISMFDKYECLLGKAVAWMPLPKPYKSDMRGGKDADKERM